jgi:hypothetical protein
LSGVGAVGITLIVLAVLFTLALWVLDDWIQERLPGWMTAKTGHPHLWAAYKAKRAKHRAAS